MSQKPLEFCPKPLLPLADFPTTGGSINGRFCTTIPTPFGTTWPCCVPCPLQDWLYPDNFPTLVDAASYVNLASVTLCLILLLSFWVLPTQKTHRHYLSVSLVFGVLIMETSFVIGLGTRDKVHKCINDITPYDMTSSVMCALSGSFVLLGGWCVVMWVFLRALHLHLQICWQVTPGRNFFFASQAIGWIIPAGMTAAALSVTGVSQRFGNTCHINTKNGLASFWGPLLAVAAASIVIQFVTFGYCINVYLRSLFEDAPSTGAGSVAYSNSRISATYTQALRRVKRVVAMQWRGILVVIVVIVDVIIFATVFLQFEGTTEKTPANIERGKAWLLCLLTNEGEKNKCLKEGEAMVVPEATAVTVLFLLSCNGFWVAVFLGRWSMITGWVDMVRGWFGYKPSTQNDEEFVSFAAARPGSASYTRNPRNYTDLPSSAATYTSDDRRYKDEYYNKETGGGGTTPSPGGFELGETKQQSSILVHESFRPKRGNTRRSFSNPSVPGVYNKKSSRPAVVNEDEEFGYSAHVSSNGRQVHYGSGADSEDDDDYTPGGLRPHYGRSNTAPGMVGIAKPIGVARTGSLRKQGQSVAQELEALEMSIASASRGRQNQRAAFPSSHRI